MEQQEPRIMVHGASTSLAGGAASFLLVCIPFIGHYLAMAAGLGGLVTGIQALRQIREDPVSYKGTGVAIAGIAVSSVSILVFWGLMVFKLVSCMTA